MTAGFSPDATDGYDNGIDSYAPPAPPPPAFDAALGWGGDRYYTQILAGDADLSEHVYDIQLQYDTNNLITVSWDNSGFSDLMTSCVLQDAFGGAFVNIDVLTGEGFANPAFASWDGSVLTLFSTAVNTLNLIVTPYAAEIGGISFEVVDEPEYGSLSGDAPNLTYTPGAAFVGNDSFTYVAFDGELYSDPGTVSIEVLSVGGADEIDLAAGWNLISFDVAIEDNAPATVFADLSGILVVVTGYGAAGANFYDPALPPFLNTLTSLDNGFGYWIKVSEAVEGFQYPEASGRIAKTVPRQTNPDIIKTNVFMFVNGSVAFENVDYTIGDMINISTESGLLVGEMEILNDGLLMTGPVYGDDFTTEEVDGALKDETLFFTYGEYTSETVSITFEGNMELTKIDLTFKNVPETFSLHQNYPNPFNPS